MIEKSEQLNEQQELYHKEETRKNEIAEITKPFYCQLCSKQYTNVAQYDQHLSSYDHHHKKVLPLSI